MSILKQFWAPKHNGPLGINWHFTLNKYLSLLYINSLEVSKGSTSCFKHLRFSKISPFNFLVPSISVFNVVACQIWNILHRGTLKINSLTLKRSNVHILDDEQRACRHYFIQGTSHSSNVTLVCWKDNLL